jgi:probable F420-dependent oxidoreductase
MACAAPNNFVLGIGTSSDVIVERWNGIRFEDPYLKVRDTIRFLQKALLGEKISEEFETFNISGFRLARVPENQPPILLAALREGMLRLAGREADGAIINWLSAEDVERVAGIVNNEGPDKEIVARIFVCPSDKKDLVLAGGKFAMAAYLNVPVYKEFHKWLGREEMLSEHWEQWDSGDRKGALEKIPDSLVDELIVNGTPDQCRDHIQRYVTAGVTCPALAIMPLTGDDVRKSVRDLAPINK